jgi:transcriptional regulator with XRE-family HTH domain
VTRTARGDADLPPGPARDLVDLLRRLRLRRELSVGQIAVKTRLSRSHVSEVLRGWKTPSPHAAAAIARALGASEAEAGKAHHSAGQARDLQYYQRTHSSPSTARQLLHVAHAVPIQGANGRREVAGPPPGTDATDGDPEPAHGARWRGSRPGPAPPAVPTRPMLEVFPVDIGHYADPGLLDLDAEVRAGRLVDVLAPFGGQHRPWKHPRRQRGADAVQRRLRDWSRPRFLAPRAGLGPGSRVSAPAESSVLYWVGHGWSDGSRATLAHAESPAVVSGSGLEPLQLAQAIRARQAGVQANGQCDESAGWALVVIDSSHSTQIADAVMAALHGPDAPVRLLLIAVPDGDTAPVGGFAGVLAGLLAVTFRAERRILLRDLAGQLERVLGVGRVYQRSLGEAALVRVWPPAASWMSAPVNAVSHLEDVLAGLPRDERSHFVAKAQGAERGEICWFFEGRQRETEQIDTWLHEAAGGMLVVTGRAGSGKSALLGNVLTLSLPVLRDALDRRGLIAVSEATGLPPEDVFDAVIHLSGLTLPQATRRVAAAVGLGRLPSQSDRSLGVANDLDWLAAQIPAAAAGRERPFTILVDALDEATHPLDIARSLLARVAGLPGVRVLAGTRTSTNETPDKRASDHNLLTALSAGQAAPGSDPCAAPGIVWVARDADAIGRYIALRLRHARDYGAGGEAVACMAEVQDADIGRAAAAVAAQDGEFLHARLEVYEFIADPTLLRPGRAASLGHLLDGGHQALFAKALGRLARLDDRYEPLMRALALARGRGIPEADGIWATIAASQMPPGEPAPGGTLTQPSQAWARSIHGLLGHAAAYITVDIAASETGPSTVYRLAHQAFTEHLDRTSENKASCQDRQRRCAAALLDYARQAAAADPACMPPYLARHLSGHVADTGMWNELAATPEVLDGLDPAAVTADALRTLSGRRPIPPPVADVIGARHDLITATPADRAGLR